MATNGSYLTSKVVNSMTGDGCPDRANISWSASWNPATLQWTVAWSANGAGYYNNNYVTIFSGTVTIKDQNGTVIQTKSMSGQIPYARRDVQLIADSFTLGVDTYGNQSLQFDAVFRIGYNSATGESTGSQTFALDQVPLASYFTNAPAGVTVGSSGGVSTVNITRYNSSYTHDVTWTFGSYSQTLTGQGTSASFTIPASWLDAIPNSLTGTCYVTLVTKSGATQVGQAVTAQFTITANVVPSYTSIVYSYRGAAYSAGITNALIAGYSNMRIAVSGAAGANGSSVARIEFIKGTSTMATVNTSAASYTYDTPLLTVAETTTFTVRITDTRGKYVQQPSQSFTIKAYALPSFTAADVYRSDSSGSPADDGTYIKITATAAATPAENSITSLQYATKETTSSSWSADADIPSGAVPGYSNTTSYDVRLTATDKLGNKVYKYYTVPTQAFTMDFKEGGKGVAFGKVAETDNLVDSAWGLKVAGTTTLNGRADIRNGTQYNGIHIAPTFYTGTIGSFLPTGIYVQYGSSSAISSNQIVFREGRPNSTPSTTINGLYYEDYTLPAPTAGLNSNAYYDILTTKGRIAPDSYSVNSGYFVITNSNITASSTIIIQDHYTSSIGASKWTYTVQPASGYAYIYVRDGNGNLPPNGTYVYVSALII